MLNSTLLELLSKFSPAEIKEFSEFISSPFFNKNKNVINFYIYIRKHYPDFGNKKLEKEIIFSKIFKGEEYNDGYMRTLMFRLQKLAEEYLSYVYFRSKEAELKIGLLSELNDRKLEKAFLKTVQEQEREFQDSQVKSYNYFRNKSELDFLKNNFYNWIRFKDKNFKDYSDESFDSGVHNFINSFLITMLGKYRFLTAKKQYTKVEYDFRLLDHIIEFLKANENQYVKYPAIRLHLNEVLLLKTKDNSFYYTLKRMLIEEKETLDVNHRYSLLNILNQYLSQKVSEGEEKYNYERFELYKIALEENIYKGTDDIYFDDIMFGAIVNLGSVISEIEWTEKFIEKYKNELPPSNKNTVLNYCLARVSFSKKNFEDALKHLSRIRTIKINQFKTVTRNLMLKCYCELSMFPQADSLVDSYRHFLLKNKELYADLRFERLTSFLKFYTKIMKLKEQFSKNDLDELKFDFIKNTNVAEREWIGEKIKEFEKQLKK